MCFAQIGLGNKWRAGQAPSHFFIPMTTTVESSIDQRLAQMDPEALRRNYLEQGEFLVIEDFLPDDTLAQWQRELPAVLPHIHRNFIPRHKKGGSVACDTVDHFAPSITGFYRRPEVIRFFQRLTGAELKECPASDQHRCALYAYTEAGDHIGWHYDTSYYKDQRWTMLVGLEDQSSSKLLCHLHTRTPARAVEKLELKVGPGMMVLFNGDKVLHSVTPTFPGEHRYVVSMQYVTSGEMNPFMRFVSNMKDAIAYFGFKGVFFGRSGKSANGKSH